MERTTTKKKRRHKLFANHFSLWHPLNVLQQRIFPPAPPPGSPLRTATFHLQLTPVESPADKKPALVNLSVKYWQSLLSNNRVHTCSNVCWSEWRPSCGGGEDVRVCMATTKKHQQRKLAQRTTKVFFFLFDYYFYKSKINVAILI